MPNTNQVHFSSQTVEWSTPPELFADLDVEFGFAVDVCRYAETRLGGRSTNIVEASTTQQPSHSAGRRHGLATVKHNIDDIPMMVAETLKD